MSIYEMTDWELWTVEIDGSVSYSWLDTVGKHLLDAIFVTTKPTIH